MKKTYVSPLTAEVSVATESIIAQSMKMDGTNKVDTSVKGNQLGNSNRGEWGNLWK